MPDMALLETNHLEVDETAYQQLKRQATDEVIRCLLATEAPSDLTTEKVRDRVRIFAACSTEPWTRVTDVIQPKAGGRGAPSNVLKKEYYRLLRTLRDQLVNTLLHKEREVWKKARRRMVNQADYAIFRVTESTVHLHRLTHNRQYRIYE
jgi:hypothetical protein